MLAVVETENNLVVVVETENNCQSKLDSKSSSLLGQDTILADISFKSKTFNL